jgi:long-chain fatty acid transport protein
MTRFHRYKGLISPLGRADLPEILSAGFAFKGIPRTVIAFDVAEILNRHAHAFGNAPTEEFGNVNTFVITVLNPHGLPGGAAFGWKNQTVYKVGVSYDWGRIDCCSCDNLILRAGYNYGKSPIPIAAGGDSAWIPVAVQNHLTLGATWSFTPCRELSFAWIHGFKHTVHGHRLPFVNAEAEAIAPIGGIKSPVTQQIDQIELEFSWLF